MPDRPNEHGRQSAAVSNAITRLHREHYGRGATSARTLIQGNYVAVFLEDVYTPVERTLLEAGKGETVRQTRHAFQEAMRQRFSESIEEVMQRRVVAFMSTVHFDPDLSVELFVLEAPTADGAPPG